MRIWFTSDLHFGHNRVAGYRGFDTTDEHDAKVMANWRSVIRPDDRVFVLGDIAMSDYDSALMKIQSLPGEKHLIAGNHDPVHPMHRRYLATLTDPLWRDTFATMLPFGTIRANGSTVKLSHFPYAADRGGVNRYAPWRLKDEGSYLIHGHTHEATRHYSPSQMHVGLDAWDLRPVPIREVDKWLADPWGAHWGTPTADLRAW